MSFYIFVKDRIYRQIDMKLKQISNFFTFSSLSRRQSMEQHHSELYNGFETPGKNYVWAGAMCLAWTELKNSIIKEPINLNTQKPSVLKMIENYNADRFKATDIDPKSIYVKSGYGKQTLDLINKEVNEKFKEKSFPPLNIPMGPEDIISYAYLMKKLQFKAKFERIPSLHKFMFNGKETEGFHASQKQHKKQICCLSYKNRDNFTIAIKSKNPNDVLVLIKNQKALTVEDVIKKAQKANNIGNMESIDKDDQFAMPVVDFDLKRTISELKLGVKNKQFTDYRIHQIFEGVKLRIDEEGAKVENEAVIAMLRCAMKPKDPKRFILDKPFWVVMKENNKHPYFVAFVNSAVEKAEV